MNDLKRDMMRIQELIGNAFRQTGSLVALTDGGQMNPNKLQKTLEQPLWNCENSASGTHREAGALRKSRFCHPWM